MSPLPPSTAPWLVPHEGAPGALARLDPDLLNIIIMAFISVAIYNGLELLVLIFLCFRRYEGLYFWSLLITNTLGVLPYCVFISLLFFQTINTVVSYVLGVICMWVMSTGESIVLWSRLHIILSNKLVLRLVLAMIIVCSISFNISEAASGIGLVSRFPKHYQNWYHAWRTIERTQITGFSVMEIIISAIYLYQCRKILPLISGRARRQTIYNLVAVSLAVVIMDAILVAFIFLQWWILQAAVRPMFYSVKLKLELAVLRKLVMVSQGNVPPTFPDFVNEDNIQGDLRHPAAEADRREPPPYTVSRTGDPDRLSFITGEGIAGGDAGSIDPAAELRSSIERRISASSYPAWTGFQHLGRSSRPGSLVRNPSLGSMQAHSDVERASAARAEA